jgi:hypothetical protein
MKHTAILTLSAGLALSISGAAHAADGESSFTPTSFVMPVYSITLAHGLTVNVPVYSCATGAASPPTTPPASADAGALAAPSTAPVTGDCLVDMADQSALDALFATPAAIPPGVYDSVVVGTCRDASSFVARVKGSVALESDTYYTSSATNAPLTTNPADEGYASITYAGCGMTVPLAQPVTIGAGDDVTVSAFFTLQGLSWVLGNLSPGLGGCAVAPAHDFSVCSGLPVLVGYVGDVAPVLDAYYITEDPSDLLATKAAGQVMLLSSGGEPFAGFLRRVYSHDSPTPSVSYDVPLREINKNADAAAVDAALDAAAPDADVLDAGTLAATYDVIAIGDPKEDLAKFRVRYPRFVLGDHTGTLLTANGASEVPYRAVKR